MAPGLLAALTWVLAVQAGQPAVAGTIRDGESGAPLSGAVVTLTDDDREVVTDTGGRYRLDATLAGPQHLSVKRIGYEPRTVHAIIPGDGVLQLDLSLHPRSAPASDDRGALRRGNPRPGEHRATGRAGSLDLGRGAAQPPVAGGARRFPGAQWRKSCRRRRRRPREFTSTAERRTTRRTCWTAYPCSAPITRRGPSAPGTRTRSSRCRCSPPLLRSRRPMHWPARWPGRRGCPAARSGPTAR